MGVNSLPEALGARPGVETHPGVRERQQDGPPPGTVLSRLWRQLRFPLAVYAITRILYFAIAVIDTFRFGRWSLDRVLSNWDGFWYLKLAAHGYPDHVSHLQTRLGFFPLYPLLIAPLQHALAHSPVSTGIVIATLGGLVATVLVQRLAAGWWGEEAARRAVLLFCVFPGSIVFTMVYSEGLLIPLAVGCILALERRRWLLAGALAGIATAVGPTAVMLIPTCLVASALELRRCGWRDPGARRSLLAPALAPVGLLAFAGYLWAHTGSPFASYIAQRYGWEERSSPWALVDTARKLIHQVERFHSTHHPGINLNYVVGIVGAVFLAYALVLLVRCRPRISAPAIVWTVGISLLTVTSANVPPNPRMLLTAFPLVAVLAYRFKGRAFGWVLGINVALLVAMSLASYVGTGLRP